MKKIVVIGCPGAGKSTFARRLKEMTGLPLYYLDQIWHKADRTTVSKEEFDAKLREIIQQDSWIIDGNYLRTMECRLDACDTPLSWKGNPIALIVAAIMALAFSGLMGLV